MTMFAFGVGFVLLRMFMDQYLPVVETRQYLLHMLVYVGTFIAFVSQIMGKIACLLSR